MNKNELVSWINYLLSIGKIGIFYNCAPWKKLKAEVLEEQHYECQECLKLGILTKADTVHHINYLKNRPDLALSKTYIDKDGKKKMNLEAICFDCHNKVHKRFVKKQPLTEEWW